MSPSLATRVCHIERRMQARRVARRSVMPDLRLAHNPVVFAREKLGFAPDPWQESVLQWQGDRLLLNCCRQSGKSTTAAILALHQALHFAGSLILLVSPSLRQSSELFRKVTDLLALLPIRPKLVEDNRLSLRLQNGSRIVSLPSKEATIRGFSGASLIIEDEAARVTDDLYLAIRPMLAVSNGRFILMSTPFGKRGHFFEAWESGASWERICIRAIECPRISPAFLAEEKATMPANWYASEYDCKFVDAVDAVFSYEHVMNAVSDEVEPLIFPVTLNHNAIDQRMSPLFGGVQ